MKPRPLTAVLLLATVGAAEAVVVRAQHGSAATAAAAAHSSTVSSISTMAAHRFGPKHCVIIEHSSGGSCVIRTDCHGLDTSAVNFAFDCWAANGDIFRHSYGQGGFAEHEEFDSGVQCAQCHPPSDDSSAKTPAPVASKATAQGTVSFAKKKASQHPLPMLTPPARAAAVIAGTEDEATQIKAASPQYAGGMGDLATRREIKTGPSVSRYGPMSCVSTWRNGEGHCVVQTACQNVDIASYEFGLICIDAKGLKTKHTFGRGSFDVVETFDTLAECSECVGLDDQRAVALRVQRRRWKQSEEANEVATLSEEVQTLTKGMTSMLSAVMKLRQKVKDEKRTTPPPSVVATLAAWSGEDASNSGASGNAEKAPATPSVATPRLRTAAAARQPQSTAQVKEGRQKNHRRKRVKEEEEDDDYDDEDEDSGEDSEEDAGSKNKARAKDGTSEEEEGSDGDQDSFTPITNGIGETLDGGYGAEASELEIATDGEASAGALDDGSSSFDAAW